MKERMMRARVIAALEALRYNDEYLLEVSCGERSITGRLQLYLVGLFPSHNVDIEYNRHGMDPKRVPLTARCRRRTADNALVLPDIVVHRRGHDDANLLVVEIKKDDCSDDELECDRQKLSVIKQDFGYEYSLLLQFPTGTGSRKKAILAEWNGDSHRGAVA